MTHRPPRSSSIGAITGLIYALLAAGLVLVYRSTGIINFAYGEIGALCAAVLAKLVDMGWPFWPSLAIVVALGAVLGGLVELVIVRRLRSSPRLVLLVATIGVGQLLYLAQLLLPLKTEQHRVPLAVQPRGAGRRLPAQRQALPRPRRRARRRRDARAVPHPHAVRHRHPRRRRQRGRRPSWPASARNRVSTLVWVAQRRPGRADRRDVQPDPRRAGRPAERGARSRPAAARPRRRADRPARLAAAGARRRPRHRRDRGAAGRQRQQQGRRRRGAVRARPAAPAEAVAQQRCRRRGLRADPAAEAGPGRARRPPAGQAAAAARRGSCRSRSRSCCRSSSAAPTRSSCSAGC